MAGLSRQPLCSRRACFFIVQVERLSGCLRLCCIETPPTHYGSAWEVLLKGVLRCLHTLLRSAPGAEAHGAVDASFHLFGLPSHTVNSMGMVYEFAGSWCRPDNIVVLVHYALNSLVFSITDLAAIHGITPARGRVFGSDCQVRTSK